MKEFWNERFLKEEYVFGIEPNLFFKGQIENLSPGKILLLGEGEGRNAVYSASIGWQVDAVDWSDIAKNKALKLAKEKNVSFNYFISELNNFEMKENSYDAIGLIYLHLNEEIREQLNKKIIASLNKGGKVILEAFEKEQLGKKSGGPQNIDLLYSLEEIVNDFIELDFEYLAKEKIILNEGTGHIGEAVVVRFVGVKI